MARSRIFAALQPFYPRAPLPKLREVTFSAQVSDSGSRIPSLSSLTLHAGASDLSTLVAGLTLAKLDVAASSMDQPVTGSGEGAFAGAPLSFTAKLGAPAALIAGGAPAGPFPVDVSAQAAGASLSAKGAIGDPVHLSGADVAVAAQVPDLAALAPFARHDLPPLKDIGFKARLGDAPGGLVHGAALREAELTLPAGDLAGDLTLEFGARPLVRAALTSKRMDLDVLRTALAARPGPSAAVLAEPSAAPAAPPRPAPPRAEPKHGWLIPDEPLPFHLLQASDADVTLRVAALTFGEVSYRNVAGHLVLQNGQLRLDPFAADVPGGRMDLTLATDASQAPPPVSVAMHAPGLALRPLLHAMGLPDDVSGNLEMDLDLRGAGRTPHAIAAGADGHLGLALVNGQIDNRLIEATLGEILRQAKMPDIGSRAGRSDVRCFAARLDAREGLAQVRALLLDTTLLHLEGQGSLNFADEKLALRLEPLARLGGTGVIVPLRVGGSFRQPKAGVDAAGAVGEAARLAEGASAKNQALGIVIGALGGDRMIAGAGRDSCAEQLAIARGGRPGPVPAALPAGNESAGSSRSFRNPPTSSASSYGEGRAESRSVKRFWDRASVAPAEGGFAILLDGRPIHVPGGPVLVVPSARLAEAIADEWQAAGGDKGGEMSFADTPLTGLAATAQQRIAPDPSPVVDALARYAESDLLCYRADTPPALVERQSREWQPWLDWAALTYDALLRVTAGITHVRQSEQAVSALRHALASFDAWTLAGLGVAVPALGSLVLGLALCARPA